MAPKPFRFTIKNEQSPLGASWIQHMFEDEVLLEATLLNAARHLDSLYQRQPDFTTLRHRGETIRMINKSLESSEPPGDSIIASVAMMAWSEVSLNPPLWSA